MVDYLLNKYYTGSGKTSLELIDTKGLVYKYFYSIVACAKYLGLSPATVYNRLLNNKSIIFDGN